LREGLQRYPFVLGFRTKDLVKSPALVDTPKKQEAENDFSASLGNYFFFNWSLKTFSNFSILGWMTIWQYG
jgi:hypothetical protein